MARRHLRVLSWVACSKSEIVPPAAPDNFYNLFEVGYYRKISADTEFPWSIARLDLYARFADGTSVRDFEVRVDWLDAPEGLRQMQTYGPFRVAFRSGVLVRETVFRCLGVPIDGPGRFRIALIYLRHQRRLRLAVDYIYVEHRP
jgi:hypothetical protein